MKIALIAAAVLAVIVGVLKTLGMFSNKKLEKLEQKVEDKKVEIIVNETKRETLKEVAVAEQTNATEQEKTDFWKKQLDDK